MILEGCQGKPQLQIFEKICPRCGNEIEIFSVDTSAVCEHCGFEIYNDMLTCVQWCQYARKCVGDETYERLMKAAERQKERAGEKPDGVYKENGSKSMKPGAAAGRKSEDEIDFPEER